jgi:hypothetical protein
MTEDICITTHVPASDLVKKRAVGIPIADWYFCQLRASREPSRIPTKVGISRSIFKIVLGGGSLPAQECPAVLVLFLSGPQGFHHRFAAVESC